MGSFLSDRHWQDIAVAAASGFVTVLAVCLLLVATRRWHGRFTNDSNHGIQKFHLGEVPRVGGLAIAWGYCVAGFLLPPDLGRFWLLTGLAALPTLAAGIREDLTKAVGVRQRLIATMVSGMIFALLTGYTMHDVDVPGIDWLLSFGVVAILFTGFAMGGVANAINIIDGFNGLAAGALLIMLAAFAWVAHQVGDDLVLALAALYGALVLGFFVVNFPLGKLFLGDGGAYLCGFLLAVLGVLLPTRNPEISAWTAILICAYPVIETLASMYRKARRDGHSVGKPDRVHFHMLAHRRYARRIVKRDGPVHLRNPVTAMVTWIVPAFTTLLVILTWHSTVLSMLAFFGTAVLYALFYRVMSLNPPRLPLNLARLL
jgi:UDP-N-acetylmuramyl pentapeptide phosphotransferase/UDP-N-acetylglucosamine-1-phosphate transferase